MKAGLIVFICIVVIVILVAAASGIYYAYYNDDDNCCTTDTMTAEEELLLDKSDDDIGELIVGQNPDFLSTGRLTTTFSREEKLKEYETVYGITEHVGTSGKAETICREFLETYYNKPFINCRPNFLKSPETMSNLELDCYNPELKIALEYNGIQHYKYPNPFHRNITQFYQQLRKDKYKHDVCAHEGIYLIRVPYNVPYREIPRYIKERLPKGRL